ncbi:nucleotide sugar dehydrogenase [Corynebacterium sp. HMSC034H07]|uniref:nucleotide sugar dehydrogenase n=1 Tax=Corynebacterium sp. HMSC034H07 TaxID=1739512 RepID=UPI0008A1C7E0|nr:nucleotide sugar dehydrogenase [Corynebacterium sp. HMSC034H07]OFO97015.1 UDP-N-acetyl-D-glucosamine dehydrogenase [Corynebacterium sp. HMSC034H07]
MQKVATIVGQGYVGLPLAQEAAKSGWKVYGFDVSQRVVDGLNAGVSHVDDLSDSDVQEMLQNGYTATASPAVLSESDVIVICVPTPLGEAGSPDLSYIEAASRTVGKNLSKNTIVILESTTYPGTTQEVCLPILEQESGLKVDSEIFVAFSPERVDPGRTDFGIKNTPKLVGGVTPESTKLAANFYRAFIENVVEMSGPKEAETAKLLENTFRHVNIALVNEMAKVCHELDIDIWEVIRGAATKPFGYMKFTPGPGVGGHCIPIDPNYLSYEVRRNLGYPLRFVELAQEINNSMPVYVATRVAEQLNDRAIALKGSKVLLLGVTYKKNIADQRESPALPLAQELARRGAEVSYIDPYVDTWNFNGHEIASEKDWEAAIAASDAVVLLQHHNEFDVNAISAASSTFLDTTGTVDDVRRRL